MLKKSSHSPDKLQPSTGLSLKPLINVYHFSGFLKRHSNGRTDDCQRAFQDLKAYLTTASLLSPSVLGEELYLYLAVTPHAVSSALVREEGRVQKPVYYTSQALKGAEA